MYRPHLDLEILRGHNDLQVAIAIQVGLEEGEIMTWVLVGVGRLLERASHLSMVGGHLSMMLLSLSHIYHAHHDRLRQCVWFIEWVVNIPARCVIPGGGWRRK